jgi:DNA-binding PadR family transcriptional regulator
VLGLLAQWPYSAYDLIGEIKASLSRCLPRSATLLYREPKNLVAQGFAEVEIQMKGRQKRAVYSVTPAGRKALQEWLASAPAPPVFESEAVVRMVFAHLGRREDLLATLSVLEEQVAELAGVGFGSISDQAMVAELYADLYAALIGWSRRARAAIEAPAAAGRYEMFPDFRES